MALGEMVGHLDTPVPFLRLGRDSEYQRKLGLKQAYCMMHFLSLFLFRVWINKLKTPDQWVWTCQQC